MHDPLVMDIIGVEPAARGKGIEHGLLAWPKDRRGKKVQAATLKGQLGAGTLVILDHDLRKVVNSGR